MALTPRQDAQVYVLLAGASGKLVRVFPPAGPEPWFKLKDLKATELGAVVVRAIVQRTGLDPQRIDDCILGQAYPGGEEPCAGRLVALMADLPEALPGSRGYHIVWHQIPAWVCMQCGEPYFAAREVALIQRALAAVDEQTASLSAG